MLVKPGWAIKTCEISQGKTGSRIKRRATNPRLAGNAPPVFDDRRCNALQNTDLRGSSSPHWRDRVLGATYVESTFWQNS